jgi:ATP-binding cassette subfamily B protein
MDEYENTKRLPFKDFIQTIFWVFKVYWNFSKYVLIILLATTLLLQLQVFVSQYIRAYIIDYAVNAAGQGNIDLRLLIPIGLLYLALNIATSIINNVDNHLHHRIRWISDPKLRMMLYQKLRSLWIQDLESPRLNNLIERAHSNAFMFPQQIDSSTRIIGSLAAFIGSSIILFHFFPLFIPLMVIVSIPMVLVDQHFLAKYWSFDRKTTEQRRSAYESMNHLVDSKSLYELLITGGYKILQRKFENFADYRIKEYQKIDLKWIAINQLNQLRNVVRVGGFLYTIWMFWQGNISIGMVTFYIGIIQNFSDSVYGITINYNDLYESSQRIKEFKDIFDIQPSFADGHIKLLKMKKGPEIEFQNVDFSYPNSHKKVINNLNLKIGSGEKIAIVGANGAGKTTLVKLIARYYQVSDGKLLINGLNINDLRAKSWNKNIGILFQEYNTYGHLTAKENIYIGDLNKRSKGKLVTSAAKRADAYSFIKEYKNKYDQVLSEKYKGGVRPSTGQWQRIAIARFFYRDVPLVIFDEPTASIDALSERKIFNKIYKFFKHKTVIIISHRFSTVRNADRIVVLDHGVIKEQGSHEQLMKLKGRYAKAFKLQAEGYR